MAWAPDYATPAELAAYIRVPEEDLQDEEQMTLALAGASRAIDQTCRRQFGALAAPAARVYTPRIDAQLQRTVVDIDDLMTVVGLLVEVDADGSGEFATEVTAVPGPPNAAADGKPWTRLVGAFPLGAPESVRVTAKWGWTDVPDSVKQACLMQASRLLARRDSPYGVAGSPDAGSEMRLLAKVDPDVAVLLRHYTRRWWAA